MEHSVREDFVHKEKISEELGISLATVNNWIKTKVIPPPDAGKYYSKNIYVQLIITVKNAQTRLNSRANRTLLGKKNICYLGITDKERKLLLSNLVNDFEKSNLTIDEGLLAVVFAALRSNDLIDANWQQDTNLKNETRQSALDKLLSKWTEKTNNLQAIISFYNKYEIPNLDDDILGAFYQSIRSVSQKSNSGSYYTPSKLLTGIKIPSDKTILDPCCGSGGILLNILSKEHDPSKIFARDIDETALKICFINLVLFFNNCNISPNISKQDITSNNANDRLSAPNNDQFDCIVTNPPWGSKFSAQRKKNLIELYPVLETTEIFSIALYNARKMLKKSGELYFFLPHSFLNVAAHKKIRQYVFNESSRCEIKLLGNAFKDVLSENILLHLTNSAGEKSIAVQNKDGNVYQIPLRDIFPPDYIVSAASNEQDALLIEKIYNTEHVTLKNGTTFALGIVTGNNKKYLLKGKTRFSEAIYRGKDIEKYAFLKPSYYIEFKPENFQQTAPEEIYRQEKIVYRFISDKLICAIDNRGSLLLNSANLFISKNYPIYTVVSFFNSDIYTFILRKRFHTKKVLKSHLQNLPLPLLSDNTHRFIRDLYNETFHDINADARLYQEKIDMIICKAFKIKNEELEHIRKFIST